MLLDFSEVVRTPTQCVTTNVLLVGTPILRSILVTINFGEIQPL